MLRQRRRGVCGECNEITTWIEGFIRGEMLRRLAVKCVQCGNTLKQ